MELQVYVLPGRALPGQGNYDFSRTIPPPQSTYPDGAIICPVPKNETTNFAKKMRTMMKMKARAQAPSAKHEIRPAPIAIDAIPPEPDAMDAIPQAPNAPGGTLQGPNVVGAIEPERNRSVGERGPASDSDAIVGQVRSNCLRRETVLRGCGGIVPGQTFWAESVAPTTSIAPVTAIGKSQGPNHTRALQVAKNDNAYPDCRLRPTDLENSLSLANGAREKNRTRNCDHPTDWRPRVNRDFAQSQPANSAAQPALYSADLKSRLSQDVISPHRRASLLAPQA